MNIKKRLKVVLFFISIFILAYVGISVIWARTDTRSLDDLYSGNIKEGVYIEGDVYHVTSAYLILTNQQQGIIPMEDEYYFLVFNEDMTKGTVFRADKDWFKRIYGEELGFYNAPSGISISGVLEKTFPVSVFEKNLIPFTEYLNAMGYYPEISMYVINAEAEKYGIYVIISVAVLIIIYAVGIIFKKLGIANRVVGIIVTVVWFADFAFLIHNAYMMI